MPGFTTHTGSIAILAQDNIDTDRIIPARYLTHVTKSGYGELLFHDVRSPDFALDKPDASGASILVVGSNFGCGSSREHAVWAIQQAGFRAVVARRDEESPGYSDIFRQNGANCGLLLAELDTCQHQKLVDAGQGATVTVNLSNQTIVAGGDVLSFDIGSATKDALLQGLDLIGTTLILESAIEAYELRDRTFVPKPGAS
ncbi:MAG: 3-isopropylmalate dehydratase small subunit [Fimbriimonadaceae bacterium]